MGWDSSKHAASTRSSRNKRALVLELHPTCRCSGCYRCERSNNVDADVSASSGCARASTDDDHIIPIHQGGSDDIANHIGLCRECHSVKTGREGRAARVGTKRKPEKHPGLT